MRDERLVDTSVWIAVLRPGEGTLAPRMGRLLEADHARLCGPVIAELLQGLPDARARQRLLDRFSGVRFLESEKMDWLGAGRLSAEARGRGRSVPLPDCLIAALAQRHGLTVLTRDKDFLRLAGVDVELV